MLKNILWTCMQQKINKHIPPFVALPSKTTRKSDWALTVTCPGYQSGLAVFKVVADICQTYSRNKVSVSVRYLEWGKFGFLSLFLTVWLYKFPNAELSQLFQQINTIFIWCEKNCENPCCHLVFLAYCRRVVIIVVVIIIFTTSDILSINFQTGRVP